MIDYLDVKKEHKVLEIGTGSGYQTAFLACIATHIYTVELVEELAESARKKLVMAGYGNISYKIGDGSKGWAENAPYDRIIVSAASSDVPEPLINQLNTNGKIVIPIGKQESQDLLIVWKDKKGIIKKESMEKVRFVEFKGKYGWQ